MKFILNNPVPSILVAVTLVLIAIPVSLKFTNQQPDRILMKAGFEDGRYMDIAERLDQILIDANIRIPSRLESLGSKDNIDWLLQPKNAERKITIAQYDVAFDSIDSNLRRSETHRRIAYQSTPHDYQSQRNRKILRVGRNSREQPFNFADA